MLSYGAHAEVTVFTDKDEWVAAVGSFVTIDFVGFPAFTFITEQYADLGVHFTDGDDNVNLGDGWSDGAGLDGNGPINVVFDTPQTHVGLDQFFSGLSVHLFSGGELTWSVKTASTEFFGAVSSEPFDSATLLFSDPLGFDEVSVGDLLFGASGPPGDLDGDFTVGVQDLLLLLAAWGPCPDPPQHCPGDLDGDAFVGVADLLMLLANWG